MAVIRHLYGLNYKDQDLDVEANYLAEFHLSVFMLGDKYDISSLRIEAAKCFDDFLEGEESDGYYYHQTIYAIQKLLGPEAPQLADQALVLSTTEFVLKYFASLFRDARFRGLLAKGVMLKNDLAIEFLDKVGQKILDD
jgi:hypothetical protein